MAQPRVGCFCFKKLEHSVLEIGTRIILTALPWPGLPDFWLKSVGCCGVFNRPGTLNKPEAARRITIQHAQSIKNLKRIWCILEKSLYNYNVLSLEPDPLHSCRHLHAISDLNPGVVLIRHPLLRTGGEATAAATLEGRRADHDHAHEDRRSTTDPLKERTVKRADL